MAKIAVSVGDLNGISLELILKSHKKLSKICTPYYFIHKNLLLKACKLLDKKLPKDFHIVEFYGSKDCVFKGNKFYSKLDVSYESDYEIRPSQIDKKSGAYSFASFKAACNFVSMNYAKALVTLSIHKKAWQEAGISYKGHTEALRDFFKQEAIMVLGNKKLFVALFTEHIALRDVSKHITVEKLCNFFINLYKSSKFKKIGVLAFNPHASDFKTIGGEEEEIMLRAIRISNVYLKQKEQSKQVLEKLIADENFLRHCEASSSGKNIYLEDLLVADTAFRADALKRCNRLVSMYHDLALAPLKALYFDESVNISLNLPIIRTSPDHGTAFDKAYKNAKISNKSYIEAVKTALKLAKIKSHQNKKL